MRSRVSIFGAVAAFGLATSMSSAAIVYVTDDVGNLLRFNSNKPTQILNSKPLSGLSQGERITGIDFRPYDLNEAYGSPAASDNIDESGQLYGLTNFSRLVKISTSFAGITVPVTTVGANPVIAGGFNGSDYGFDFNPTIDRIRVVSNSGDNYVINPNTGVATVATALAYAASDPNFGAAPNVTGSAYDTNDQNPATTTSQLYGIDSDLNILVKQANSAGTLMTVGPLGTNPSAVIGFDIEAGTGIAYTALITNDVSNNAVSSLYTVNLLTGAATNIGQIDGGLRITALSVALPEPTTLAALGGLVTTLVRRRRH